jgi:hypothetical protein
MRSQPRRLLWYFDSYIHIIRILFSDRIILPHNHLQRVVNGTLTIDKVQKQQDSGEYVCIAKNSNGQGSNQSVYVSVVG